MDITHPSEGWVVGSIPAGGAISLTPVRTLFRLINKHETNANRIVIGVNEV